MIHKCRLHTRPFARRRIRRSSSLRLARVNRSPARSRVVLFSCLPDITMAFRPVSLHRANPIDAPANKRPNRPRLDHRPNTVNRLRRNRRDWPLGNLRLDGRNGIPDRPESTASYRRLAARGRRGQDRSRQNETFHGIVSIAGTAASVIQITGQGNPSPRIHSRPASHILDPLTATSRRTSFGSNRTVRSPTRYSLSLFRFAWARTKPGDIPIIAAAVFASIRVEKSTS